MRQCQCIFPSPTEAEVVTVPGDTPDTAWRVYAETSVDGYLRIQQMAHDPSIGWYVQKSMVIPRDVLTAMLPQLRKAMCLMPPRQPASALPADHGPIPFPRLTDSPVEPLDRCGS